MLGNKEHCLTLTRYGIPLGVKNLRINLAIQDLSNSPNRFSSGANRPWSVFPVWSLPQYRWWFRSTQACICCSDEWIYYPYHFYAQALGVASCSWLQCKVWYCFYSSLCRRSRFCQSSLHFNAWLQRFPIIVVSARRALSTKQSPDKWRKALNRGDCFGCCAPSQKHF